MRPKGMRIRWNRMGWVRTGQDKTEQGRMGWDGTGQDKMG